MTAFMTVASRDRLMAEVSVKDVPES